MLLWLVPSEKSPALYFPGSKATVSCETHKGGAPGRIWGCVPEDVGLLVAFSIQLGMYHLVI